jgi:hypothetical protein
VSEMLEQVARAMWDQRRKWAGNVPIELEEWGDGSIPKANGIMEEARAALAVIEEAGYEMVPEGWHICSNDD